MPSDVLQQFGGTATQSDEPNVLLVELIQVGMSGEARIEDEFFRDSAGTFFPVGDETENFIVVLVLAQIAVDVAEHPALCVLSEEGEHPFLLAAAFGHVMFFHQGVVAMEGNGMKVEIEGRTQTQAERADGGAGDAALTAINRSLSQVSSSPRLNPLEVAELVRHSARP